MFRFLNFIIFFNIFCRIFLVFFVTFYFDIILISLYTSRCNYLFDCYPFVCTSFSRTVLSFKSSNDTVLSHFDMYASGSSKKILSTSSVSHGGDILLELDRDRSRVDLDAKRSFIEQISPAVKRKRFSCDEKSDEKIDLDPSTASSSLFSGAVLMRDRVSLSDHLQRLFYLLSWSDRHDSRWMGIRNFIDAYFSLVFHPYFGKAFKLNVLHVAKSQKICAVFSLSNDRTYTILVMLNYPLWDSILQVSTALPNRYFRRSIRSRVRDACRRRTYDGVSVEFRENEDELKENSVVDDNFTYLFNVSLAALCLVDRLECSMAADLETAGATHVVTLAKFFTMCDDAKQMLNTLTVIE